jgi:hypothetical protein
VGGVAIHSGYAAFFNLSSTTFDHIPTWSDTFAVDGLICLHTVNSDELPSAVNGW